MLAHTWSKWPMKEQCYSSTAQGQQSSFAARLSSIINEGVGFGVLLFAGGK